MKEDWSKMDLQLKKDSDFFSKELKIDKDTINHIATKLAEEINDLSPDDKLEIRNSDLIDLRYRYQEVNAFNMGMNNTFLNDPAIGRLKMLATNYLAFVYLNESVFNRLYKRMDRDTLTKKCCKFLINNPVRAFRNALAHGNWRFKTDFSGIVYWARKGDQVDEPIVDFEVSGTNLKSWQSIALGIGYIIFSELCE